MSRLIRLLCVAALSIGAAHADPESTDPTDDTAASVPAEKITVYKSPTCGCCKRWIAHLEDAGFEVEAIDSDDMNAIKQRYEVPGNMTSCHTARVAGYTIEGHVPASDIRRLLAEQHDPVRIDAVAHFHARRADRHTGHGQPGRGRTFGEQGDRAWSAYDADGPVDAGDASD